MTTTVVEEAVAVLTAAEAAIVTTTTVMVVVVAVVVAVDEADAVAINPMVEVEDALADVVAVTTVAVTAFIREIRDMSIRKRK